MLRGEITLLYAAPERVTTPRFLSQLDSLRERGMLVAVRDRRSALREPVGPRLPARVPRADGAARALRRRAAHRAHRHRRCADARRHRRAAAARGGAPVRLQLRPAEHPLHHRREEGRDHAAAALHRARARGRCGRRLLPVEQARGRRGPDAARRGHQRPALPRGPGRRGAPEAPGPVPARRRHRDGRDHRLRHGHRQARRALRGPSRHAEEHRGLLPGNRPRRPRRRTGRRLDGLRPAGRGEPAPHDRREPGRRRVQAGDARQARCAALAGRGQRLPARAAARLLRREEHALRQLRQLRQPAAGVGRHGCRAQAALHHLPRAAAKRHQLRRRPHHGHPARQDDREGHAVRPWLAQHLRHRQRVQRGPAARRAAPADRDRRAGGRCAGLQHAAAHRGLARGAQGRDAGGAARVGVIAGRTQAAAREDRARRALAGRGRARCGRPGALRRAQGLARRGRARAQPAGLRDLP